MGKVTDQFKGDSTRVSASCRPFLRTGISMADVKRFDENKATRIVVPKKKGRNVVRSTTHSL